MKKRNSWKRQRNLDNLPDCFIQSEASEQAKQVMGALLYLAENYKKANEKGFLVASNAQLYEQTEMSKTRVMDGVEELVSYGIIERVPGTKREKGEKGIASSYYFDIERLYHPLVKKEKISDDKLKEKFSFLTPSKPSVHRDGAANTNSSTSTDTSIANKVGIFDKVYDGDSDTVSVRDKVLSSCDVQTKTGVACNFSSFDDFYLVRSKTPELLRTDGFTNMDWEFYKMYEDGKKPSATAMGASPY